MSQCVRSARASRIMSHRVRSASATLRGRRRPGCHPPTPSWRITASGAVSSSASPHVPTALRPPLPLWPRVHPNVFRKHELNVDAPAPIAYQPPPLLSYFTIAFPQRFYICFTLETKSILAGNLCLPRRHRH